MASIYDDIRAALESKLYSLTDLPVLYPEGSTRTPTVGTPYIKHLFVPVTRRPAVTGSNPQKKYSGVFRVFCYYPSDKGPAQADDMADKIIEAFDAPTNIPFTNSDSEVIIVTTNYAERDEGRPDKPWYYVTINIGWYIYK